MKTIRARSHTSTCFEAPSQMQRDLSTVDHSSACQIKPQALIFNSHCGVIIVRPYLTLYRQINNCIRVRVHNFIYPALDGQQPPCKLIHMRCFVSRLRRLPMISDFLHSKYQTTQDECTDPNNGIWNKSKCKERQAQGHLQTPGDHCDICQPPLDIVNGSTDRIEAD